MDWTQTITIISVNVALFALFATLGIWSLNKLDSDIKGISSRMDSHAARIDQLYKMFVDLLKAQKP